MAEKIEKLTYDSFMPLYHQLKEIFLEKIETEELREGDMIHSENELQQMHLDLDALLTGSSMAKVPVAVYMVTESALTKQVLRFPTKQFDFRGKQHYAKQLYYYFGS